MAKIILANATQKQLIALATLQLGLEIDGKPSKADLMAKIVGAGFTGTEFEIEGDDEDTNEGVALTPETIAGRKTVRINIGIQENVAGGTDAVPIGVNGKVALVMRGVDVDVPAEYVEVLNNAKKAVYGKGPNGELTAPTLVHIYPFSILGVVA